MVSHRMSVLEPGLEKPRCSVLQKSSKIQYADDFDHICRLVENICTFTILPKFSPNILFSSNPGFLQAQLELTWEQCRVPGHCGVPERGRVLFFLFPVGLDLLPVVQQVLPVLREPVPEATNKGKTTITFVYFNNVEKFAF